MGLRQTMARREGLNLKVFGNQIITKILNLVLPLIGICLMLVYEYCDTSCTYLKGSFIGIDLKWLGVIYMAVLFLSAFYFKDFIASAMVYMRTILISAAVGVEFFLIGFQIVKDTYCPFCLAFSVCIFILLGINFTSMNKRLMFISILAGLIGFMFFFEGQVSPTFDLK